MTGARGFSGLLVDWAGRHFLVAAAVLAGVVVSSGVVMAGEGDGGATEDCCGCGFEAVETFSASDAVPCDFDHPAGWTEAAGDDGASVQAIATAPSCPKPCAGSSGVTFLVAKRPDANADTMEEAWSQMMRVIGKARCGGRVVTFFETPGSEPTGLLGGLRFHIGHDGKSYGGSATFTCSEPGAWLELRQLFIDSFTTNPDTTFGQ